MRLATVRSDDGTGTWAASVEGDELVELAAPDVRAVLDAGAPTAIGRPATPRRVAVADARLAPVVPEPRKVICVGLNYRHHILEMGRELPTHPTLFAKYALALTGPRDPIPVPAESPQVDWEAELAIVIGRPARRVAVAAALDHIAGYTVLNDVSMRDWQYRTLQWLQGKTWERSTPVGPWLVTPDEIDHAADLRLSCEVDGQLVQEAAHVRPPVPPARRRLLHLDVRDVGARRHHRHRHAGRGGPRPRPAGLPAAGQRRAHGDRGDRRAPQRLRRGLTVAGGAGMCYM